MEEMFRKSIRKLDIQLHKTNVKAKTWRESGFAYQIKEEGTEDENCCSKERTRTARTQREKMKNGRWMIQEKERLFCERGERKKRQKGAGLFKKFEVRRRRDNSSRPIRARHVAREREALQSWLKRRFWPDEEKPEVKLARLERLKGF